MPALLFPVGAQPAVTRNSYSRELSGVIINQDTPVTVIAPGALGVAPVQTINSSSMVYQTFTLPSDLARAGTFYPSLTGLHVYATVDVGTAATAEADWRLDMYVTSTGWVTLDAGSTVGSAVEGNEVWFQIFFDKAIATQADYLGNRFRFGIAGSHGLSAFWYSSPNPLAPTFDKAYSDSNTPLVGSQGGDISMVFRVLADVADSGIDFLGNSYRSTVIRSSTDAVTTANSDRDKYWLSAPQPSKFAVVSQYFDMSQEGEPVVIDSVMVDPITPGIFAQFYYSSEGEAADNAADWDNKLWTPIPQPYQLNTRTNFYFPKPVTARYIKVEYSHLQAQYYAAGEFQKPTLYKKHPKWVTDYFLARILTKNTEDPLVPRRVQVIYDALDFAYNYYTDDVTSQPDTPPKIEDIIKTLTTEDASVTDLDTLIRIRLALQPFTNQPALLGRSDYLLGSYVASTTTDDYPTEIIDQSRASTEEVSSLEREPVIVEKSYPVMFFYVTCRHAYRVALAKFDQDRAYFAGVNEIAFLRSRYDSRTDTPLYIETVGDLVNVQRSDFESVDFTWVTYRDS